MKVHKKYLNMVVSPQLFNILNNKLVSDLPEVKVEAILTLNAFIEGADAAEFEEFIKNNEVLIPCLLACLENEKGDSVYRLIRIALGCLDILIEGGNIISPHFDE